MREILIARIPWGTNDRRDVYYEYAVGFFFDDLGVCQKIVEHSPGHIDVLFEEAFITYCNGLITKGKINHENQE